MIRLVLPHHSWTIAVAPMSCHGKRAWTNLPRKCSLHGTNEARSARRAATGAGGVRRQLTLRQGLQTRPSAGPTLGGRTCSSKVPGLQRDQHARDVPSNISIDSSARTFGSSLRLGPACSRRGRQQVRRSARRPHQRAGEERPAGGRAAHRLSLLCGAMEAAQARPCAHANKRDFAAWGEGSARTGASSITAGNVPDGTAPPWGRSARSNAAYYRAMQTGKRAT